MVVSLRRRLWRVESVEGGVLTGTPIDDFSARPQQFLLSLEQPTPGTLPEPSLESLGDFTLQTLFLRAARLDALHGAAPFVSVQRAAIIPVEYQLVPLVMALRLPKARLLIADTTGLGKTIEAGLIATELLARNRARSILIITPANLREQWRQQMRDLFYHDFEIMSGETRKRLERAIPPGADPWRHFDKLIVSIDYAKDIRIRPEIRKRRWDIVIVDEAHNASMPHSHQGRKSEMERWEAIDQISQSCEHLLLLTATPHNGYTDSYCSLLSMLAPDLVQTINGQVQPARVRAARHVCQRTRKDVQAWFDEAGIKFPFPAREPAGKTEVAVDLHRDYFRLLEKMDKVLDFVTLHADQQGHSQAAEWLRLHLHRRALSSPEALRQSLENRLEKLKQIAARPTAEPESEAPLLASLNDAGGSDVATEDDRDRTADTAILSIEHRLQVQYFGDLLEELKAIRPAKDRKLIALRDQVLPDLMGKARSEPDTPARVIVFTRFTDTLTYLQKELTKGADYEIISLYGDLSPAERSRRYEQFAASPRALLLATDVISEGLNLQAAACMIVHYDLPYNPIRLEQRNGRVDRFGQRAPTVFIRTLFCRDTTDEDVMHHLVRKLERMRQDFGFSPPFFASEETVLRVLTRRRKRRAEHPPAARLQTALFDDDESLYDEAAIQRMRTEGFYGQADVRINDVSERLHEVHRRFGSPQQIRSFIKTGLSHYQCGVEERPDGTLRIEIKNPRLRVPGQPAAYDRAVLDANELRLHPDATVLDVGHPLIRRLNAVIREDALRQTAEGARTSAHYVKDQRGTILLAHGVLRAAAATRPPALLEEIVTFGVRGGLSGGILTREEVEAALARPVTSRAVDREDSLDRMRTLSSTPQWQEARDQAIAATLQALHSYRAGIAHDLRTEADAAWLQGFDTVEAVAFDLYCLTLLLPEDL
jgi:superfamily II DNA or RNA helicase